MTSRTCPRHAGVPLSHAADIATGPWLTAEVWDALRSAILDGQNEFEDAKDNNKNSTDPKDPRKDERIRQALTALVRQVKGDQDAPQIASCIVDILQTQSCNPTMYKHVKDAALAECHQLAKDVVCHCKTESFMRLVPTMALLGHLVKRGVISTSPVLVLAQSLLQEMDRPLRIECVRTLLVNPTTGVLTERHYSYLIEFSLKEMEARRKEIEALGCSTA